MIEINLLAEDLKKKRKKKKEPFRMPDMTIAALPIIIGVIALLVLSHAALMLTMHVNNISYKKMAGEWEKVKFQKSSIELTKRGNIRMQKGVDAIEGLMDKRISWSKKLNQLSDLIIPRLWFTKVSLDKKVITTGTKRAGQRKKVLGKKTAVGKKDEIHYLSIEGEVTSVRGEELAIIGKFINRLKSDPDFFKDFSSIELGSTEMHSIGEMEVMKFNINCYFKKGIQCETC